MGNTCWCNKEIGGTLLCTNWANEGERSILVMGNLTGIWGGEKVVEAFCQLALKRKVGERNGSAEMKGKADLVRGLEG